MNMADYAGVVVIGGDGTIHEAVNGMLMRLDGNKLPIGLLPNGSGDDFCGGFGLGTGDLENAIGFILKGQTIKIDAVKVLIDYDNEEQLREAAAKDSSIKLSDYMRYSCVNSSLCLSANCARNA